MTPILIWLFFIQIIFSTPFPDARYSATPGVSETSTLAPRATRFYTVYPSDENDTAQLSQTKTFLETLSDDDVLDNVYVGRLISWRLALKAGASVDQLKDHLGIRLFEPEDAPLGQRSVVERDEPEVKEWILLAKDLENVEQVNKTRQWLDSKAQDPSNIVEMYEIYRKGIDMNNRKVRGWGRVFLSNNAVEEAKKRPDIGSVLLDPDLVDFGSASATLDRELRQLDKRHARLKRASIEWAKQEKAPKDLKMDSQYEGAAGLDQLSDFVYEKAAGEGTVIYVIDAGINIHVNNAQGEEEFAHYDESRILQTPSSKAANQDPKVDEGGHGTLVASKAAGKTHGIAKGATIIPVKMNKKFDELAEALSIICDDILSRAGPIPAQKSVVLASVGSGVWTPESARPSDTGDDLLSLIELIHSEGVPIVLASGNEGDKGRPNIDSIPQVLQGDDAPLINVGASDYDGNAAGFTQGGPQLTIYAPGVDVEVQSRDDGKVITVNGTSVSAPVVAGLIATYMNYSPWEKDPSNPQMLGITRVRAIRTYLQSMASSWIRKDDVKVIWNGAGQQAHKSVGANPPPDPPPEPAPAPSPSPTPAPAPAPAPAPENPKTCNGIDNKHYIIQETMAVLIDQSFCPDAVDQGVLDQNSGSIARTYLKGTMEQVDIAMDWQPGLDFKPNLDDCKKYMHELLEGCDTTFPMHWKGGGNIHVGDVVYRWNPTTLRQAPMASPWGGCDKDYKLVLEQYTIWGAGWLNSGFGHELHDALNAKGLSPSKWDFQYGLGDDGREWTLKVRTVVFAEDRVQDAIAEVANYPGFGIDCTS